MKNIVLNQIHPLERCCQVNFLFPEPIQVPRSASSSGNELASFTELDDDGHALIEQDWLFFLRWRSWSFLAVAGWACQWSYVIISKLIKNVKNFKLSNNLNIFLSFAKTHPPWGHLVQLRTHQTWLANTVVGQAGPFWLDAR